jgi:hypothetical protein
LRGLKLQQTRLRANVTRRPARETSGLSPTRCSRTALLLLTDVIIERQRARRARAVPLRALLARAQHRYGRPRLCTARAESTVNVALSLARCTLDKAVTAKEKLLERAPHWSEEQAERALRAAERDTDVDDWGNVSDVREASTAETMQRLAEEERAAGHKPW